MAYPPVMDPPDEHSRPRRAPGTNALTRALGTAMLADKGLLYAAPSPAPEARPQRGAAHAVRRRERFR